MNQQQRDLQRMKQSRETMPDWANDESDWKALLYGIGLAIGGVAVIVALLRWIL